MECETSIWEKALPAIMALAGVLITLIVQGFFERSRRNHESKLGSRVPLTTACEELLALLEEQMSAITDIEGIVNAGADPFEHPSLLKLAEKSYRKKLWAIIEDQECVQPINRYAEKVEQVAKKLVERKIDKETPNEIKDARNHLGMAIKNVTKHLAGIWGLEVVR
jgi:hypothetical protein